MSRRKLQPTITRTAIEVSLRELSGVKESVDELDPDCAARYVNTRSTASCRRPPARASELPEGKGLYALSEGGKYRYVGITRNLRRLWLGHRYGGSGAATLAIRFARERTKRLPAYTSAEGLKALLKTDKFIAAFKDAKIPIRQMDLRFLEWDGNDADLAVLEIYAARALKTPYNDFSPH